MDEVIERANKLLLSLLSPEQEEMFAKEGRFKVIGSLGGEYAISRGVFWFNVEQINNHDVFCAHPNLHYLPNSDHLIVQKAWLEADEADFLWRANRFRRFGVYNG